MNTARPRYSSAWKYIARPPNSQVPRRMTMKTLIALDSVPACAFEPGITHQKTVAAGARPTASRQQ